MQDSERFNLFLYILNQEKNFQEVQELINNSSVEELFESITGWEPERVQVAINMAEIKGMVEKVWIH